VTSMPTRRKLIGAVAGSTASIATPAGMRQAQAQPAGKTFVLVHGAWHGGWCWRRVADLLQKRGHKVFTPTMTGLGERSHLLSKDITLDTHISDIVNVFKWEDLRNVCLVAHSYAGWPCTGALEQIGDRVSSIVWLDAFKPADSEETDPASDASRKDMAALLARGILGRRPPSAAKLFVNPKDQAWIDSKLTPQPISAALQPVKFNGARERVAKKLYIRAPRFPQKAFDKAHAECQADKSWKTLITTAGHNVMIDAPNWLAERLVEFA
jgi:pimeloyl-ACP methyl ester carboxylesterase